MAEFVEPLSKAFGRLQSATLTVAQRGLANPEEAAAVASDYLKLFGFVAMAYLWAQMALSAQRARGRQSAEYYSAKIQTARFFYVQLLPKTSALFATIMAGGSAVLDFEQRAF